jgi:hypothetical protein
MSELIDLLDEFVADLDRGIVSAADEKVGYGKVWAGEMPAFFQLITLLHNALVPVKPRPTFAVELKQRLTTHPISPIKTTNPRNRLWLSAAAIGSILSVTGITLFFLRRLRVTPPQIQPTT